MEIQVLTRDSFKVNGKVVNGHIDGNVQATTWIFNWFKGQGLDEVARLRILAKHLHRAGRSTDAIAGILNRLAPLHAASHNGTCSAHLRQQWVDELAWYRAFVDGLPEGDDFLWSAPLPEPDIARLIQRYNAPKAEWMNWEPMCSHGCRSLTSWSAGGRSKSGLCGSGGCDGETEEETDTTRRRPEGPPLTRNKGGVPTFVFSDQTDTRTILELLARCIQRAEDDCDDVFPPPRPRHLREMGAALRLAQECLSQGYFRADGLVGIHGRADGLPFCFAGVPRHPLAPSLASHGRHHELFRSPSSVDELDDLSSFNLDIESWGTNMFRGSTRAGVLEHFIEQTRAGAHALLDKLAHRGVLEPFLLPRYTLGPQLERAWCRNGQSNLELILRNPNFVDELEFRRDAYIADHPVCQDDDSAEARRAERMSRRIELLRVVSRDADKISARYLQKASTSKPGPEAARPFPHVRVSTVQELLATGELRADHPAVADLAGYIRELPNYRQYIYRECGGTGGPSKFSGADADGQRSCWTCIERARIDERRALVDHWCEMCPEGEKEKATRSHDGAEVSAYGVVR